MADNGSASRDEPIVLLAARWVEMSADERREAVEALTALLDFAARQRGAATVLEGEREDDVSLWGGTGEPAQAATGT